MSGISDDLATHSLQSDLAVLRRLLPYSPSLARVEAELVRLTRFGETPYPAEGAAFLAEKVVAAEAEVERLTEALGEIAHICQTRRVSLHIDGTEKYANPAIGEIAGIARAVLAGREDTPQ